MERYARQLIMPEIGAEGQKKLKNASVLVVGAGGLGSAALFCLAGAGVGRLGIVDCDTVSESNLNRQFLHAVEDLGREKTLSAAEKLKKFNPEPEYALFQTELTAENADELLRGWDVVLPAVDNLPARRVINAACLRLGIPMINGGVSGMIGSLQAVIPGETACLECLYGGVSAPEGPIASFAPVVSTISALMAQAALLLLLGQPLPFKDSLLCFDGRAMTMEAVPLRKNPKCPVCGR